MFLPIFLPFGGFALFLAGYGIGRMIRERRQLQPYYWRWYTFKHFPALYTRPYHYYYASRRQIYQVYPYYYCWWL